MLGVSMTTQTIITQTLALICNTYIAFSKKPLNIYIATLLFNIFALLTGLFQKDYGISALKAIKAFDANAKVVMCSAMGQKAMVIDAINSGAKDFIVKPFSKEKVIEVVKKFAC